MCLPTVLRAWAISPCAQTAQQSACRVRLEDLVRATAPRLGRYFLRALVAASGPTDEKCPVVRGYRCLQLHPCFASTIRAAQVTFTLAGFSSSHQCMFIAASMPRAYAQGCWQCSVSSLQHPQLVAYNTYPAAFFSHAVPLLAGCVQGHTVVPEAVFALLQSDGLPELIARARLDCSACIPRIAASFRSRTFQNRNCQPPMQVRPA